MSVANNVLAIRGHLKDWYELTKPRITLLVLITAYTGMWLASGGLPALKLTFFTMLGIALAASSSSTLNNYIDRGIDRLMSRTQDRPLAAGRLAPEPALVFGICLGVASFALLALTVNLISAVLAVSTILFYVCVYTIWLKRTTPMCTSIGGIAGALPPVIGLTAVTGEIGLAALALFGVMFLWQPPHFWAIALIRAEEYRRAKIPMLPVVKGEQRTKLQMLLYTMALLPASASLYWFKLVGPFYLGVALVMSIAYLGMTIAFMRKPMTRQSAYRLFFFSIIYLCVLFVMMFVDCQTGLLI